MRIAMEMSMSHKKVLATPAQAGTERPATAARKLTRVQPAKLLRSKWTASRPENREKHFMVVALVQPDPPDAPIDVVTIEAVLTGRSFDLPWRALQDPEVWVQGWR